MIDIDFVINTCLKELNLEKLPLYIEIKYIDSCDFFKLTEKGVPEEKTIEIPVLTLKEDDKNIIYVNYLELNQNEYIVIEMLLSQIIKVIMQNEINYLSFKEKNKNTLFQKNIQLGLNMFLEYKELCIVMDTMKKVYNSKEHYQKNNPYTPRQSKKIALKILEKIIKEKEDKISTIIYCLVKLNVNENYDFSTVGQEKANYLSELNNLFINLKYETISKKDLNKIGGLGLILNNSVKI